MLETDESLALTDTNAPGDFIGAPEGTRRRVAPTGDPVVGGGNALMGIPLMGIP